MRLLAIFVATALTTDSVASPLLKRDLSLVIKKIYVYPDGEIVSTALSTTSIPEPTVAPISSQPVPQSHESHAESQPSAQSQSNNIQTSSLNNVAVGVSKYIDNHANQAVRTRTGFVAPSDPLFSQMAVFHTNAHRANSSVQGLTWDQGLADEAQKWANLCIMDEEVGRPDGTGVNAAWSSSGQFNPSDFISQGWYNGEFHKYPWGEGDAVSNSDPAFMGYGHLSQLLWETTTTFGCGIRNDCGDAWKSHALCYYSPPGNYAGQFSKVKTPGNGPILRPNGQ